MYKPRDKIDTVRPLPKEVEGIVQFNDIPSLPKDIYKTGKTLIFERGIMVIIPLQEKTNIPHLLSHLKKLDSKKPKDYQDQVRVNQVNTKKRGINTLTLLSKEKLKRLTGFDPGEVSPLLIHQQLEANNFSLNHIIIDTGVLNNYEIDKAREVESITTEKAYQQYVLCGSGDAEDAFVVKMEAFLPSLRNYFHQVPLSILDITSPESPSIDIHLYTVDKEFHLSLPEKNTFTQLLKICNLLQSTILYDKYTKISNLNTLSNHAQSYTCKRGLYSHRSALYLHTVDLHPMFLKMKEIASKKTIFTLSADMVPSFSLPFMNRLCDSLALYWRKVSPFSYCIEPFVRFVHMDIPIGISEIVPNFLYLGSMKDFNQHQNKFDVVIALSSNSSHESSDSYIYFKLKDTRAAPISSCISTILPLLECYRSRKKKVLIHSVKGMSRSAALVMAYLMRTHQFSAERAFVHLKSIRHFIHPNSGFLKYLNQFELDCVPQYLNHDVTDGPLVLSSTQKVVSFYRIQSLFLHRHVSSSVPKKRHRKQESNNVNYLYIQYTINTLRDHFTMFPIRTPISSFSDFLSICEVEDLKEKVDNGFSSYTLPSTAPSLFSKALFTIYSQLYQ